MLNATCHVISNLFSEFCVRRVCEIPSKPKRANNCVCVPVGTRPDASFGCIQARLENMLIYLSIELIIAIFVALPFVLFRLRRHNVLLFFYCLIHRAHTG